LLSSFSLANGQAERPDENLGNAQALAGFMHCAPHARVVAL